MQDSGDPVAGPSNHAGASRADATLLRQFVMEYLQQHGFDKALTMFQQGIANQEDEKDADGEDEGGATAGGTAGAAGGANANASAAGGREAIFRAPGPIPIDSTLKRNIPQAQALSASTLSGRITPEFEAQAKYIIDLIQKRAELKDGDGDGAEDKVQAGGAKGDPILDPSDRVLGYRKFRRWVDDGLELWRPELDAISFPLFAHTFLDLMAFGFTEAARKFFEANKSHHIQAHSQEISSLSGVVNRFHLTTSSCCQQLRSHRYTIMLSRNAYDLLLQWLSGGGLDEEWESGLHTSAGRAKDAVKAIINDHVKVSVSASSIALDEVVIASTNGLLPSTVTRSASLDTFNTQARLKLGPIPMTEKLKEQVSRTLQDEEDEARNEGVNGDSEAEPNGHLNGDGDVDMDREVEKEPVVREVKLEPDLVDTSDLVSPGENDTLPPVPPVFRISDLKREVEAIRDRRKMIRLGPGVDESASAMTPAVLPSVVAFTLFDSAQTATSVEFSRDSSLMAVGSPESCIRLWSLKGEKLKAKSIDPLDGLLVEDDGLPMRKLIGHSGPVYSVSFDPIHGSSAPPQSLLSSSQDGTVRLWSLDTYSNLVVYRGHSKDPVWDVEWGPMGVYFATASRDRTARLWSSDRVNPLRMYTGHLSDVNCVKFHPNSLYLASGSNDNSCRLWDVQRGACVRLFLGHTDAVTTIAISPDGRTLASAGLDSNIWLWDLGSSRPIKKMSGHRGPVQSLSFSAESSVLVSGGLDSTVRCWDVKSAGGDRTKMGSSEENRVIDAGRATGELPMSRTSIKVETVDSTSDLLATFHTKRTPVLKTHYTPRNLCMVAGTFVPPSSSTATELVNGKA
ncbi:WD40-repeat-containing domain protein [Kockovaella imperatae]|uniref:WD40-repeat-containing domain protein n=1 Tax=Kockovaella imperatae TaxID=4999 RepID=A0A1Y1UB32_9TREE|nr:WD40-repeat-containing domain protein [Kockovaella imperatae]ORX35243.1 WD40-repeat-containing domain protein [Kockovaella imperatae]